MRKIAIFTSGTSEGARRVTSLFNEGNRIRVEAVVADNEESAAMLRSLDPSVKVFTFADWGSRREEIITFLKETGVEKFALENCEAELFRIPDDPYFENVETFVLTDEDKAPQEVVAAFKETQRVGNAITPDHAPSVDEEWAETLKMDYDEQTAQQAPPPIPGAQAPALPSGSAPQRTPGNPQQPISNLQNSPSLDPKDMPNSYLVWSIVTTIFCCLVPGVVAIIFSSQVSSKYYSGDKEGAEKASRNAQIWIIVSFVLGVLSATLYLPIALIN